MIISGQFRNVKNDLITVNINNTTITGENVTIGENGLFFSGDPVVIQTNNDDTFEHIIKKSAQINLVTKNYVGNLFFADNAKSVEVEIKKNNTTIFKGYLEPNTFSQGFATPLEEFTLNCTDYLSVLQYLNYNDCTVNNYDEKKAEAGNTSFQTIIEGIFEDATGCKIYYDLSKGLTQGNESTVFADLSINEMNLYGEDFDDIMTQEDALNEILKYLNLHIIQDGADFYIFDWATIKNKRNNWVDILTGNLLTTSAETITLLSDFHGSDDTNITIADVYNQVQVECKLESQETVIESPLDKDNLASYYNGRAHYMTEYICKNQGQLQNLVDGGKNDNPDEIKVIDWYVRPLYNNHWKLRTTTGYIDDLTEYDNNNVAINPYKLPLYGKQHQITPLLLKFGSIENAENTKDNAPIPSISMKDYLYITINGNAVNTEAGASPTTTTIEDAQPIIEYVGQNGGVFSPNDDETTNYIVFSGKMTLQAIQWESDHFNNIKTRQSSGDAFTRSRGTGAAYQCFAVPVDGGEKYYTRKFYQNAYPKQKNDTTLTGINVQPPVKDMMFHFEGDKYGSSDFKYQWTSTGDGVDRFSKLPLLECELIIGNKRLVEYRMDEHGNSSFTWTDINSGVIENYVDVDGQKKTYLKQTFSLGINPKIDDVILDQEFDIQNTIDWTMDVDAVGTAIPIKKSDNLSGAVIFRILGPINLIWNDVTRRHPSFWRHTRWYDSNKIILAHLENIIITDFEAKLYSDGAGLVNDNDNDLIYMSAENDKYYNKKDDIEFNFITQLSSQEAAEKEVTQDICINAVLSTSTNAPISSIYNAANNETAKAEEHYVNDYYLEYSTPKIQMELTLHDDDNTKVKNLNNIYHSTPLNRDFYIIGKTDDLKNNLSTIRLKEK